MPIQIALLRGVNVGGNPLKMDALRDICADLGLSAARTYAQSGNLVFRATGTRWLTALERRIAAMTRLPVTVIPRKAAELDDVMAENPFLAEKDVDVAKLHVTFLGARPEAAAVAALRALDGRGDACELIGRHVYLHCPNGYGRTRLSNTTLETALGLRATTRNWNTVTTLRAMATDVPKGR